MYSRDCVTNTVVRSVSEQAVRAPVRLPRQTRPFVPPGYVDEMRAYWLANAVLSVSLDTRMCSG